MRARRLPTVVALLALVATGSTAAAPAFTPAEQKYLTARDAAEKKIGAEYQASQNHEDANDDAMQAEDKASLAELTTLIREAVGPVNVNGFSGEGRINLETLVPEVGFGLEDGLRFDNKTEALVATTKNLVLESNAAEGKKDLRGLSDGDNGYYASVFEPDIAYTVFAELPVKRPHDLDIARAFLVVRSQDIGALTPDAIVTFASAGDRVLMMRDVLPHDLPAIPDCSARWKEADARRAARLQHYQTSQDDKDLDDSSKMEDEAFRQYAACWSAAAKKQPFFSDVTRQARSMIDRLAPAATRAR